MNTIQGKLYLIPNTLGDNNPLDVLPELVKKVIENTDTFIVENEKAARRFIKKITPEKPQPSLKLFALNKFTEASEIPNFLNPCLNGTNIGLLSDAGCPGVADPGAEIVKIAHQKTYKWFPLLDLLQF